MFKKPLRGRLRTLLEGRDWLFVLPNPTSFLSLVAGGLGAEPPRIFYFGVTSAYCNIILKYNCIYIAVKK